MNEGLPGCVRSPFHPDSPPGQGRELLKQRQSSNVKRGPQSCSESGCIRASGGALTTQVSAHLYLLSPQLQVGQVSPAEQLLLLSMAAVQRSLVSPVRGGLQVPS